MKSLTPALLAGLALLTLLAGCALEPRPAATGLKPGTVLKGGGGAPLPWPQFEKRLDSAQVVIVGEVHDHPDHHRIQAKILEHLSREPAGLVVGVEWLDSGAQEACGLLSAGRVSVDEFAEKAQWKQRWGYSLDLYRPVLELVRERSLPLVAMNAPTAVIRQVARKGLGSLQPDQRALLAPSLDLDDPAYRRRLAMASHAHGNLKPRARENFYTAQVARDETMAHNLAARLTPWPDGGKRALVLAGGGHLYFGQGLPGRIRRRLPGAKLITVMPASPGSEELEPPPPGAPPLADYLVVSQAPPPRRPRLGLFLKKAPQGLLIKRVWPGSAAAKAGMKDGDILLSVDGKTLNTVKDIHNVLKSSPYEAHVYQVSRSGQTLRLEITLPEP
jgi:uncharacterized iron-regulated protein